MNCAWVFVVWGDPKYLIGALAGAESLRMQKTRHKIVLLYANMTVPTRELVTLFDETRRTEILEFDCREPRTKRQRELYGGAFSRTVCTKWQCLQLEKYEKVMFIDSDIIFTKNSDELFDLHAPAGCFSTPFAQPFAHGGIPNVYGVLRHGDTVTPAKVRAGLRGGFSACGGMVLLQPSRHAYVNFLRWARDHQPLGHPGSYSAIDEQAICEFYADRNQAWTHIDQKYQYIPWKPNWMPNSRNPLRDASGLHFYHAPLWETGPGADWPDTKIWWRVWYVFEKKYPKVAARMRKYMTHYVPKES